MEASALVVAGVGMAASFVAGAIERSMADEPEMPQIGAADMTRGLRANPRSTAEILPVIYGKLRVGGNTVFMESAGANNNELWMVQSLSEGECDSIAQDGGVDQVFLADKLYNQYGSNVSYWFHAGTDSQTYDTNLHSAISKWTDNLRNTCYLVWKLVYDKDYFQSLPNRTVTLKGKKLYDFRDSTTAWSDNPVLVLYDYMTNSRYGMGVSSSKIDTTSWTSAANYCDTKSWAFNGAVNRDQAALDVLQMICENFRGQLVWYDGMFYLRYADLNYESSVMTLDDEHVVQEEDGVASMRISEPSKFNVPDALRVRFIDADKDYVEDSVMVGDNTGVVKEVRLNGCTSRQQASDIGTYMLERKQLDKTIVGTFRDDALQLEPFDVVTLNCSAFAISDQLMRVQSTEILASGLVNLALAYESAALYDDDYNIDTEDTYSCDLPDPTDEPSGVVNVQATEETYNYRLRTFTRLKITFDEPADYPWFDHVEVWLSYDDSTWEHIFDSTNDFEISNVEESITYYIRLKVVSIWGTKQQDSNDYKITKTIQGYVDVPASLGSLEAVVNQNTINLYSAKVSDPDIELYEFRLGASWSGGIFLAALR
jgi:hypothetical protein